MWSSHYRILKMKSRQFDRQSVWTSLTWNKFVVAVSFQILSKALFINIILISVQWCIRPKVDTVFLNKVRNQKFAFSFSLFCISMDRTHTFMCSCTVHSRILRTLTEYCSSCCIVIHSAAIKLKLQNHHRWICTLSIQCGNSLHNLSLFDSLLYFYPRLQLPENKLYLFMFCIYACHMPCPSRLSRYNLPNSTW
jgi:hypothetical protein